MCWAHLLKELHLKQGKVKHVKYVQVNGKTVGAWPRKSLKSTTILVQSIQWMLVTQQYFGGGKTEVLGVKTTADPRRTLSIVHLSACLSVRHALLLLLPHAICYSDDVFYLLSLWLQKLARYIVYYILTNFFNVFSIIMDSWLHLKSQKFEQWCRFIVFAIHTVIDAIFIQTKNEIINLKWRWETVQITLIQECKIISCQKCYM